VVDEGGESGESREKSFTATDTGGSVNFDGLFAENQASKAHTTNDPGSEGQVTVTWDNVPQAVSYNIYWKDSPGVTRQNGKKIANVMNPYTIKGLERGKKYYMVVTAVAPSGESMESEELSFTVK
jgi:fibronectin type 3 domain-containing protein